MSRFVVALLAISAFTVAARAADMPVKARSVAPVPMYNWTGFYAGGHIGGGWVTQNSKFLSTTGVALDPVGTTYGTNRSAFLGGGQLGYNYQIQNWVLGISGDFSWTHATVDTITNGSLVAGSVIHSQGKTDWYATLTGRVGYAFNNWLFYAKGGGAWVHDTYGGFATVAGATTTNGDVKSTRSGWTVGGGVEWGFWDRWTAFVEYDYIDVGTKTITFTSSAATTARYDINGQVSLVKGGVNYRF